MRYNYKNKEELLQIEDFCCVECLFEDFLNAHLHARADESVHLLADIELTGIFLTKLLSIGYTAGMVSIDEVDYCSTYILTLNNEGEVWIEPALREDGVYSYAEGGDLVYAYEDDVTHEMIKQLETDKNHVLLFGFEE